MGMHVGWGSGERKRARYKVQIKGMPPRQCGTNKNHPDVEALMTERTLTAHTCAEVHACCATVEQRRRRRTVEGKYISQKRNLGSVLFSDTVNARKRRAAPPADTRETSDQSYTCVSSLLFTLRVGLGVRWAALT